jgi:endonuclease/exonuclease/phosphatase family metal-dependent hydrolase
MRRLLSLALLLAAACTTTPTTAAVTSFTVVTCNVRYGTARDGADAWPLRCDALAALLLAQDPAILGVQEALAFQVTFLEQRLPHHRRIGQGRDGGSLGEHASLFIDTRRFAIEDSGDFWLSPTPAVIGSVGWDAALTRICTWARLRQLDTGRVLKVWNTHFDHRGVQARRRSAELIATYLAEAPGPQLLLGDFNAGEASPPLAVLHAAGLRDTFRDVHPTATAVGTFHAFQGGTGGDKIDYVLANAGVETRDAAILIAPAANGRWVSDHHVVTATVALAR